MIDLQRAAVADHISDLEREAAALRAERDRDHVRSHTAARGDPAGHASHDETPRVRVGRWLVAMGEAIAGSRPSVRTRDAAGGPCDDGPHGLSTAA